MNDLFPACLRLKGQKLLVKRSDPNSPTLRYNSLLLQRPSVLDDISAVITEHPAEVLPEWFRIGFGILILCRQGDGLSRHGIFDIRIVLMGGNCDQTEQ